MSDLDDFLGKSDEKSCNKKEIDNPDDVVEPISVNESVNDSRHDPYPTVKAENHKVEPQVDKTPKGIGGDRKEENPLKDEGELTQTQLQKTLVGADPDRKDSEFVFETENEVKNHNNGPRNEGSEQSSRTEEPYPQVGKDSKNGEKSMQDIDDPLNTWQEANPNVAPAINPPPQPVPAMPRDENGLPIQPDKIANQMRMQQQEIVRRKGNAKVTIGYSKK